MPSRRRGPAWIEGEVNRADEDRSRARAKRRPAHRLFAQWGLVFSDSNGRQYGPFQTKAECEQTRSQIPAFLRPSSCAEGSTR
jgi:hypothetical protein